ncbi:MAG: hypothetical protein ACQETM_03995, partial [Bacteroidota bacterium]
MIDIATFNQLTQYPANRKAQRKSSASAASVETETTGKDSESVFHQLAQGLFLCMLSWPVRLHFQDELWIARKFELLPQPFPAVIIADDRQGQKPSMALLSKFH